MKQLWYTPQEAAIENECSSASIIRWSKEAKKELGEEVIIVRHGTKTFVRLTLKGCIILQRLKGEGRFLNKPSFWKKLSLLIK